MGVAVFQVVFCAAMDEVWMCHLLVRSAGGGAKQTRVCVCEATYLLASQVNRHFVKLVKLTLTLSVEVWCSVLSSPALRVSDCK